MMGNMMAGFGMGGGVATSGLFGGISQPSDMFSGMPSMGGGMMGAFGGAAGAGGLFGNPFGGVASAQPS
jgi:hypothetical protein